MSFVIWNAQRLLIHLTIQKTNNGQARLKFLVINGITSHLFFFTIQDTMQWIAMHWNTVQCWMHVWKLRAAQFNRVHLRAEMDHDWIVIVSLSTILFWKTHFILNAFTAAVKAVAEGTSKYIFFLFSNDVYKTMKKGRKSESEFIMPIHVINEFHIQTSSMSRQQKSSFHFAHTLFIDL